MPSKINKIWHEANPMPRCPTKEQRAVWHIEHSKHCACREMTPKIAEMVAEYLAAKTGAKKTVAIKSAKPAKTNGKQEFTAKLEFGDGGGAWVNIPPKVMEVYATQGRVPVKALIDGEPYRGSLVKMGGDCHRLGVLKALREKIGKGEGDSVHVVLERDTEERTVEVPPDLQKALNKDKTAKANFAAFAFTHKKEYVRWIEEARKPETRATRIEKAVEMISEGKKRS